MASPRGHGEERRRVRADPQDARRVNIYRDDRGDVAERAHRISGVSLHPDTRSPRSRSN